jgi:hypothetical protein
MSLLSCPRDNHRWRKGERKKVKGISMDSATSRRRAVTEEVKATDKDKKERGIKTANTPSGYACHPFYKRGIKTNNFQFNNTLPMLQARPVTWGLREPIPKCILFSADGFCDKCILFFAVIPLKKPFSLEKGDANEVGTGCQTKSDGVFCR